MENSNESWYLGVNIQKVLFAMLMLGFLVKLPAVPFHTWLPDAHVQAPTDGSMLLAGVMLKTGAYGMFRLPISLFPTCFTIFPTGTVDRRYGLTGMRRYRLSLTNEPQENGCLLIRFSHGSHSRWYRNNATDGMDSSTVHGVRSRYHRSNAVRSM